MNRSLSYQQPPWRTAAVVFAITVSAVHAQPATLTPMSGVGGANIVALAVDQSASAGVPPLTAVVVPGVGLFSGRPSAVAGAASGAVANWVLEPVCAWCAQLAPVFIDPIGFDSQGRMWLYDGRWMVRGANGAWSEQSLPRTPDGFERNYEVYADSAGFTQLGLRTQARVGNYAIGNSKGSAGAIDIHGKNGYRAALPYVRWNNTFYISIHQVAATPRTLYAATDFGVYQFSVDLTQNPETNAASYAAGTWVNIGPDGSSTPTQLRGIKGRTLVAASDGTLTLGTLAHGLYRRAAGSTVWQPLETSGSTAQLAITADIRADGTAYTVLGGGLALLPATGSVSDAAMIASRTANSVGLPGGEFGQLVAAGGAGDVYGRVTGDATVYARAGRALSWMPVMEGLDGPMAHLGPAYRGVVVRTQSGSLYRRAGDAASGAWIRVDSANGPILAVAGDAADGVWVAFASSVARRNASTGAWTRYTAPFARAGAVVQFIVTPDTAITGPAGKSALIALTASDGALRFNAATDEWESLGKAGLPIAQTLGGLLATQINAGVVVGEYLYIGTDDGVFRKSLNAGVDDTWASLNAGLADRGVLTIAVDNAERVIVGTVNGAFIRAATGTDSQPLPSWTLLPGFASKSISAVVAVRDETVISARAQGAQLASVFVRRY
jgi:hypothetical protein